MNIDLRNITEEFERSVNQIKRELDIKTNSKAVEHVVLNFANMENKIRRLENELLEAKQKLSLYERRLDNLKDLFGWIMQE